MLRHLLSKLHRGDGAAAPSPQQLEPTEQLQDDDLTKPIWLDVPSDAEMKLRELMQEASATQTAPPSEDPLEHLSPHEKQVLETLVHARVLTVSEVASMLGQDKAHAYEVMISLSEKGYARFTTTEDNERAIVAEISSLEEATESRWQCAACHAFLKINEIAFGICPRCGSTAFWAP